MKSKGLISGLYSGFDIKLNGILARILFMRADLCEGALAKCRRHFLFPYLYQLGYAKELICGTIELTKYSELN